jgi:Rha family phage regulatory protein|nr:MAG TPA: regulatory protein [Caudoviricetes sp.]DAV99240.1 MAG TPA: regulatory protein [Caudoviricetes sp.]
MTDIILSTQNGEPVASSRQIAENFGKEHKDTLESIRQILAAENSATKSMFYETTFENRGKQYPMYLMNRDGFTLLAMGFTGKAALEWKLKYIAAFNEMEKKLAEQPQLTRSQLIATALIAAHEELEEKDKRIAELTPDAEFARAVCIADNCRTATSIAKDYGLTAEKLNKLLYSQRVQYKDSDGQWVLYKPYQGKGYTKNRKGKAIQRSNGKTYIPNTTVWTVEGEKLIHEQLKKLGITPRIETRAVAEQQDFGGWEG